MNRKLHNEKRTRRANRTRARVRGVADRPRLTVFRSNRGLYAQVIDDAKHATLAAASTAQLDKAAAKKSKVEQGALLGALIAERAKAAGVTSAVFDRGSYRFHGRIKAVAEGARGAGLTI
jgi:large subunit ribosomal protein L18